MSEGGPIKQRDSFVADLGRAFDAWRKDPRIPEITVALAVASVLPTALTIISPAFGTLALLALPIAVFSIGFYGTQRLWYMRVFNNGSPLSGNEIWEFSWRYLGRYFVLGLLVAAVSIPFYIVFFAMVMAPAFGDIHPGMRSGEIARHFQYWPGSLVLIVPYLLIDFALTFVTPALAYTTQSVRRALSIGLRLIPASWPSNAIYVMVPPLAFQLASSIPNSLAGNSRLILVAAAPVVIVANLAAKGAAAAFYLRRVRTGDLGSLYAEFLDPWDHE